MFKQHNIITAIELGTSKISVLIGEYTDDELTVIGHGESSCGDAIVKGEIIAMDSVQEKLIEAIDQADIQSDRELNNSAMIVLAVTGCDMDTFVSEGTAFIQSENGTVTEEDICEAVYNAKLKQLPVDRSKVNSFDAYYKLDGIRQVPYPLNLQASTLQAYSHVIHGNSNRLENFSAALAYCGLECDPELIFSPVADIFGILSDEELESGTLLIDFGAGTTEYAVVCKNGVMASGVLALGFEHVASDLSVGLNLPVNYCRKMLQDGTLEKLVRENHSFCECRTSSGAMRKIPVDSFIRIVDARIGEIFELIRGRLSRESFWRNLASGCVLTGGGAEFFRTREIFRQVCDLPSRIGQPYNVQGCSELNNPRSSTIYGALCYGHKVCLQNDSRRPDSFGEGIRDKISGLGDAFARTFKSLRKNMKI